ncbi:MAG TPA: hypothetical protein VMO52_06120 [Acidimicrobiia bacterium]|nr:hypothetical protein [Acidimicrobiia bacterium]
MDVTALTGFGLVAAVGAIFGLIGGLVGSADRLIGTFLMGAIGGITLSAVFALAGWPAIYEVDDYSLVWSAVGGFVLGWAISRSN